MTSQQPEIILEDDERAASLQTVTGWVARNGQFWGNDERMARYCGATHRRCQCGHVHNIRGYCEPCHERKTAERHAALPQAEWDGVAMLFVGDEYFSDMESLVDHFLERDLDPDDVTVIICKPNGVRELTTDFCSDELPEDGDIPADVEEAMDAFNKAVAGIVLSWSPGKFRLSDKDMDVLRESINQAKAASV